MTAPQRGRTRPRAQPARPYNPPTPRPTPPKLPRDPEPPVNECGPSLKNPERVFIADRAGRATVVFDTRGELSDANKHWLKYGRLDLAAERRDDETIRGIRGMSVDTRVMVIGRLHEVIDLTAVEDGAEQADLDRKQPQKRTRGSDAELDRCGPSSAKKRRESDTVWPEEQQKALWIAQLRYGEGRDWDAVVSAVNVFPGGDTRTLKECKAQWTIQRAQLFG